MPRSARYLTPELQQDTIIGTLRPHTCDCPSCIAVPLHLSKTHTQQQGIPHIPRRTMSTGSLDTMTNSAEAAASKLSDPKGTEEDFGEPVAPTAATDVEKAALEVPAKPSMPSFPDGGFMARMAVAGLWLVCGSTPLPVQITCNWVHGG